MEPTKKLNLITSVVTILNMIFLAGQGTTVSTESIMDVVQSETGMSLIVNLVLLLFTPAIKTYTRIKANGFDWSVFKSRNFVAHVSSLAVLVSGCWLDHETAAFVGALVIQLGNFAVHQFGKK